MPGPKHIPNVIRIQDGVAYMALTNRRKEVIAEAILDVADVPLVLSYPYRWSASWCKKTQSYYVIARLVRPDGRASSLRLHRYLIKPLPGFDTDHKNHDTLDNRRANLRACTRAENTQNYRPGAYQSRKGGRGIPGILTERQIEFVKAKQRWRARLVVAGVRRSCGTHRTREAAIARVEAERDKLRG